MASAKYAGVQADAIICRWRSRSNQLKSFDPGHRCCRHQSSGRGVCRNCRCARGARGKRARGAWSNCRCATSQSPKGFAGLQEDIPRETPGCIKARSRGEPEFRVKNGTSIGTQTAIAGALVGRHLIITPTTRRLRSVLTRDRAWPGPRRSLLQPCWRVGLKPPR
jgi:hypothetical protein